VIDEFKITNNLACAEDSYHIFWSNSYGKYLHIPRPLYKWYLRGDSESHNTNVKPGFNDNFEIALNKLNSSDYGIDTTFNDVYVETCALGSYNIGELKNKKVSLWTRVLSDTQKEKIQILYSDSELNFNNQNDDIHIICLNFFNGHELEIVLNKIQNKKILFSLIPNLLGEQTNPSLSGQEAHIFILASAIVFFAGSSIFNASRKLLNQPSAMCFNAIY
jgi:hypothetical protein